MFHIILTTPCIASLYTSGVAIGESQLFDSFFSILFTRDMLRFFVSYNIICSKALAPDWDSLADKYSASSSVAIVSVDCTTDENSDLCQEYGVQGYPTLKYFKDGSTDGEDYQGGRSLDELEKFVEEELDKKCIVGTDEEMKKEASNCSEKEQGYATKMRAKQRSERKVQIERLNNMKDGSMKPELKSWIFQRLHILNSLEAADEAKDEF